jgi:hypothetical protein
MCVSSRCSRWMSTMGCVSGCRYIDVIADLMIGDLNGRRGMRGRYRTWLQQLRVVAFLALSLSLRGHSVKFWFDQLAVLCRWTYYLSSSYILYRVLHALLALVLGSPKASLLWPGGVGTNTTLTKWHVDRVADFRSSVAVAYSFVLVAGERGSSLYLPGLFILDIDWDRWSTTSPASPFPSTTSKYPVRGILP